MKTVSLTRKQFDVLTYIEKNASKLSQRKIAEATKMSSGTVNKIIAELSDAKLIENSAITELGYAALEPYRVKRAIFIAAGFGSRLVPITLNTPKPLVRVKGVRMIDTLLDAVVAAGIEEIAAKHGLMDLGSKPVEHWFATRNDVCETYIDQPTYYNLGAVVDTCEISANWSVIGKIYESVRARMIAEVDNLYLVGGHSSHSYVTGTNLYFEFAYIAKDHAPEAIEEEYFRVLSIIMEEVLRFGGSIAHHHGSGKYRTKWMPEEHGSSYSLMYKIKEALDPNGVMNKGVILVDKE